MMKRNRSLLAVLLAVLLFCGCFTGCGRQDSALQETGSSVTQTDAQSGTGSGDQQEITEAPRGDMVTIWVIGKQFNYREDGSLYGMVEYHYDETGLRTGASVYNADGTFNRDLPSHTYTIDGNTITRNTVHAEEEQKKDYIDYYTFDADGRVTQTSRKYVANGLYYYCWRLYYDENGNLTRADNHFDSNREITDEPCGTRNYVKDEYGRIVSWKVGGGDEARVTWDENGRPATYAVYDTSNDKLRSSFVYAFEYQAIEVPAQYAAAAQATGIYQDFFTN